VTTVNKVSIIYITTIHIPNLRGDNYAVSIYYILLTLNKMFNVVQQARLFSILINTTTSYKRITNTSSNDYASITPMFHTLGFMNKK
jgi:hypothetical protein